MANMGRYPTAFDAVNPADYVPATGGLLPEEEIAQRMQRIFAPRLGPEEEPYTPRELQLQDPREVKEGFLGRISDFVTGVGERIDPSAFRKQKERQNAMIIASILGGVGAVGRRQKQERGEAVTRENISRTKKYELGEQARMTEATQRQARRGQEEFQREHAERQALASDVLSGQDAERRKQTAEFEANLRSERAPIDAAAAAAADIETKIKFGLLTRRDGLLYTPEQLASIDAAALSKQVLQRGELWGLVPNDLKNEITNLRAQRGQILASLSSIGMQSRHPSVLAERAKLMQAQRVIDNNYEVLRKQAYEGAMGALDRVVPERERGFVRAYIEGMYGSSGRERAEIEGAVSTPMMNPMKWEKAKFEERRNMVLEAVRVGMEAQNPEVEMLMMREVSDRMRNDPNLDSSFEAQAALRSLIDKVKRRQMQQMAQPQPPTQEGAVDRLNQFYDAPPLSPDSTDADR